LSFFISSMYERGSVNKHDVSNIDINSMRTRMMDLREESFTYVHIEKETRIQEQICSLLYKFNKNLVLTFFAESLVIVKEMRTEI
jgi:hypothetical protein